MAVQVLKFTGLFLLFIIIICCGIRTITCQSITTPQPETCENFDVRLVNGSDKTEGRLELCANGYWSNVCNDYRAEALQLDAYSLWTKFAAKLVCRKLGFPTDVALHNYDGSPYGSNPSLPLVTVDCGFGYYPYNPVLDNITADCRIIDSCSSERSIVGVSCGERTPFTATIEVFPAQESYEIGTNVTLRCIPPPSFHWRSPYIYWLDTATTRFYYRTTLSVVIPPHYPASVNYHCFVYGGQFYFNRILLGRGRTTLKIKDLNFYQDTDKDAATRNEGATLTCRASIKFPPFTMLSIIKNRQTVATSSSGMLEINIKTVNANPFGVYTCRLNASGEIFEKTVFLKEQVSIRLMIKKDSQRICDYSTEPIEQALISKISTECRCNFNRDDFSDSNVVCEESGKLTYRSSIEYSNSEGSETASVIVNRLASQAPFSLMVEGMPVRVTAVVQDCTDCKSSLQSAVLSPAAASGLFVGGFATGALIVFIIVIILMIIIIGVRKYCQSRTDDESKPGDNDKTGTLTSQTAPMCPIRNDKDNVIELKEK